jgi:hypothetical protein
VGFSRKGRVRSCLTKDEGNGIHNSSACLAFFHTPVNINYRQHVPDAAGIPISSSLAWSVSYVVTADDDHRHEPLKQLKSCPFQAISMDWIVSRVRPILFSFFFVSFWGSTPRCGVVRAFYIHEPWDAAVWWRTWRESGVPLLSTWGSPGREGSSRILGNVFTIRIKKTFLAFM